MSKKHKREKEKKSEELKRLLEEWNCETLQEAKSLAREEMELYYSLKKYGIKI